MAFNRCKALNFIQQTSSQMTGRETAECWSERGRQQELHSSMVKNWELCPKEEHQNYNLKSRPETPLPNHEWEPMHSCPAPGIATAYTSSRHQGFTSLYQPSVPFNSQPCSIANKVFHSHFPNVLWLDFQGAGLSLHWQPPVLLPFLHLYGLQDRKVHPVPFTIHFLPKLISFG